MDLAINMILSKTGMIDIVLEMRMYIVPGM